LLGNFGARHVQFLYHIKILNIQLIFHISE